MALLLEQQHMTNTTPNQQHTTRQCLVNSQDVNYILLRQA